MTSQPLSWNCTSTEAEEKELHGGYWLSNGSVEFYAKTWTPPNKPVATLTFIHGLGEHILRYEHVFEAFKNRGIRVFAFDQRGFGRTVHRNNLKDGMILGDNGGWDVMLGDVKVACSKELKGVREEGLPHFLFGHSMGGLVVLKAAEKFGKELDLAGIIVSAPAIQPGFPVPYLKRVFGSLASKVFGSLNIPTELDSSKISQDKEVVEKYVKDPLVHDKGSLRLLAGMLAEGDHLNKDTWNGPEGLPVLFSHGNLDKLTSFPASKNFYERLPNKDKKFLEYEGGWHELHNEPIKEKVINDYITWILEHSSN